MRADEAREIDALARDQNRRDNQSAPGWLPALAIGLASWVVIFVLVGRLYRWWQA